MVCVSGNRGCMSSMRGYLYIYIVEIHIDNAPQCTSKHAVFFSRTDCRITYVYLLDMIKPLPLLFPLPLIRIIVWRTKFDAFESIESKSKDCEAKERREKERVRLSSVKRRERRIGSITITRSERIEER